MLVPSMLICHCKGASERQIRRAVRAGAVTAPQVAEHCGAGGGCGGCIQAVEEIVKSEIQATAAANDRLVLNVAPAR